MPHLKRDTMQEPLSILTTSALNVRGQTHEIYIGKVKIKNSYCNDTSDLVNKIWNQD